MEHRGDSRDKLVAGWRGNGYEERRKVMGVAEGGGGDILVIQHSRPM